MPPGNFDQFTIGYMKGKISEYRKLIMNSLYGSFGDFVFEKEKIKCPSTSLKMLIKYLKRGKTIKKYDKEKSLVYFIEEDDNVGSYHLLVPLNDFVRKIVDHEDLGREVEKAGFPEEALKILLAD